MIKSGMCSSSINVDFISICLLKIYTYNELIITTHDTDCNGRFQLGETVMERATEQDVLKQE